MILKKHSGGGKVEHIECIAVVQIKNVYMFYEKKN